MTMIHISEILKQFAITDIGLTEDEAERAVEDYEIMEDEDED